MPVVHHFSRPEVAFREICRVLKPGGRLVFAVWGAPEEQSSVGAFCGAVMAHHDLDELPHGPLFGVTEKSVYEAMLSKAGMTDFELSTHAVTWQIDWREPLLKGFLNWGAMSALPVAVQEKIRETVRENSQPFKDGEGFSLPHTALLGVAVKAAAGEQ
jgi:SAM-dependent methyltransferase